MAEVQKTISEWTEYMEGKTVVLESRLTDIANAIRTKGGADRLLYVSEMAAAVLAIPQDGGGGGGEGGGNIEAKRGTRIFVEDTPYWEIEHGLSKYPELVLIQATCPASRYAIRGCMALTSENLKIGNTAADGNKYLGYVSAYNASSMPIESSINSTFANRIAQIRSSGGEVYTLAPNISDTYQFKAGITYTWYAIALEKPIDEIIDN